STQSAVCGHLRADDRSAEIDPQEPFAAIGLNEQVCPEADLRSFYNARLIAGLALRTRPVKAALRVAVGGLSDGAKDGVCTGASDERWQGYIWHVSVRRLPIAAGSALAYDPPWRTRRRVSYTAEAAPGMPRGARPHHPAPKALTVER